MTAPDEPISNQPDDPGPRGDPRVAEPYAGIPAELAAGAADLGDLDGLPAGEHVARYEAVHAALQDALTAIDSV